MFCTQSDHLLPPDFNPDGVGGQWEPRVAAQVWEMAAWAQGGRGDGEHVEKYQRV